MTEAETENSLLKDTLTTEVMHRQGLAKELEMQTRKMQGLQIRFGEELQAIRGMAKAKDFDAILKKVNSLIGGDANEVAQPQLEQTGPANESDAGATGNRDAGKVPEAGSNSPSNS